MILPQKSHLICASSPVTWSGAPQLGHIRVLSSDMMSVSAMTLIDWGNGHSTSMGQTTQFENYRCFSTVYEFRRNAKARCGDKLIRRPAESLGKADRDYR